MNQVAQALVDGTSTGALYALTAVGFVLIYKSTAVLNMAHGELALLGAYIALVLAEDHGATYGLAVAAAVAATAVVAWLCQRTLLQRVADRDEFVIILVTVGLGLALRSLVGYVFGTQERRFPSPLAETTWFLGDLAVWELQVTIVATTVVLIGGLAAFFRFSRFGLAMRAMAEDQAVGRLMGISVLAVFAFSWMTAGAFAAVAGILSANVSFASLSLSEIGIRALPAAVAGGFDSIGGALVGGVVLGVIEALAVSYLGGQTGQLAGFGALLAILVFRPYGLFGQKELKRV